MSPGFDASMDTLLLFCEPLFFVQTRDDSINFTKLRGKGRGTLN